MYEKKYYADAVKDGFHYLQYTPAEAKRGEKLPLLVFMHGAGERGASDGSELELVARYGYFKQAGKGREFPFYMVGPQCPRDRYWGSYLETLNRFLDTVIKENNVDTDRIYLTGLSMGGTGTWLWALGDPERFAAAAPVCGQGINWYAGKLTQMPIRAYHGDIDDIVSPHESLEMVSSINRRGGHATLTLLHGIKHNAWEYAYTDELVAWFMEQSRKT